MDDVTKIRKNLDHFIKQIENSFCVSLHSVNDVIHNSITVETLEQFSIC